MSIFKKASIAPIVRSVVSQGLEDQDFSSRPPIQHPILREKTDSLDKAKSQIQEYINIYTQKMEQDKEAEAWEDYAEHMGEVSGLMKALKIINALT